MPHARPASALALAIALAGSQAAAQSSESDDYTRHELLGPRHDGAAAGTLEASEGAGFAVAWRAALGAGYSSVAVAGGRAVTLFSDGKSDVAAAFDVRTGRELWRYPIAPTLRGKDGSFDGPIATPVAVADRVYGLGPLGHLFALDAASGRELWKVDLAASEKAPAPHYGYGASPVLADGDRKSTRLNSSHTMTSRMPSSA